MRSVAAVLAAVLVLVCLSSASLADVVYNVGVGQTYGTIAAAMAAIPKGVALTENHIVTVHANTPGGTLSLDGGIYQIKVPPNILATKTNRVVLQAAPGDDIKIYNSWSAGRLQVNSNNATIRGFHFTGTTGWGHIAPGHGYTVGGLLVYNNQFDGATPVRMDFDDGGNWTRDPSLVDYNAIFANNYVTNASAAVGGNMLYSMNMDAIAGNLLISPGAPGGLGNENGYFINNTLVNPIAGTGFGATTGDTSEAGKTFANNICVNGQAGQDGWMWVGNINLMTASANMHNNLCDATNARWGGWSLSTGGKWFLTTLASFNAKMTEYGLAGEMNGLDDTDPLFVNAAGGNYRLQALSPAAGTGVAQDWLNMVTAFNLSQAGAMGSYWNSVRDPGLAPGGSQRGAMAVAALPIPEPASFVLVALCIGAVSAMRRTA